MSPSNRAAKRWDVPGSRLFFIPAQSHGIEPMPSGRETRVEAAPLQAPMLELVELLYFVATRAAAPNIATPLTLLTIRVARGLANNGRARAASSDNSK